MNIGGIIPNYAANINSIAASFMINADFFSQGVGRGSSRCGQGKLKVWAGEAQGERLVLFMRGNQLLLRHG